MKKISLLFLSGFLAFASFSQVTIGLRLSPSLCIGRVKDLNNADSVTFGNNGSGVRFAIGPTFDFKFGDNYAFSTGAWYLSSRAGMTISDDHSSKKETTTSIVSLQSVQIPFTFKVFTNEIATDLKLYFQLGVLGTINFYEKYKESNPALVGTYQNRYNLIDISLYMGAGLNYKIGESNALFAGFYYSRGLTNVMNSKTEPLTLAKYSQNAKYNMDLIGLEIGVTF